MSLAVVVNTTDKYSHIWDAWYHHFRKHWKHDFPIYFLNEEKDIPYPFTQIKVNIPEKDLWTKKLRESIVQIPEDNLLVLLDDLFLIDVFEEGELEFVYKFFLDSGADVIQIRGDSRYTTEAPTTTPKISKLNDDSQYLISHQPNIWKKDFLLECIEVDESPWASEKKGTARIQNKGFNIYHYRKDWFVNVLRKGKVVPEYKDMLDES